MESLEFRVKIRCVRLRRHVFMQCDARLQGGVKTPPYELPEGEQL